MKRLIIVAGPTAIGKTAYAIRLAQLLDTEIVSCDSRQFYRELRIGVARPDEDELKAAKHHFIACRSVEQPYNVYEYEQDALKVIAQLHEQHDTAIAVGGSGLYIDAIVNGFIPMPDPTPELRHQLQETPLEEKQKMLQEADPDYFDTVDKNNPARLQRALEVCLTMGKPYSQVIAEHSPQPRQFATEYHILQTTDADLKERINRRVNAMIANGLVEEVKGLYELRHLNTLRTVGYRELFPVIEGTATLTSAIEQIKLDTWHYARKQKTWIKKYPGTIISQS